MSSKVYILVLNLGTNNESIFIVNDGEKQTLLTFETMGDARQYAVRLGENNFDVPGVGEVAMGNISQYCKSQGLGLRYIRQGESALVPQNNSLTTLANEDNNKIFLIVFLRYVSKNNLCCSLQS